MIQVSKKPTTNRAFAIVFRNSLHSIIVLYITNSNHSSLRKLGHRHSMLQNCKFMEIAMVSGVLNGSKSSHIVSWKCHRYCLERCMSYYSVKLALLLFRQRRLDFRLAGRGCAGARICTVAGKQTTGATWPKYSKSFLPVGQWLLASCRSARRAATYA